MSLLKDIAEQPDAPKPVAVAQDKPSRFSMISEFNVQKALKTSDGSDAGKNDVVDRASAASDIGFNLMRNTINSSGSVTGSDVADYIERAEELNDEVDTVPFGLETDDGKIVKVYVNAEQADKFEEAMKNMLGLEDDIEEAINRLTTDFDIVDVVWPKADDEDGDGQPDPDEDLSIDDASTLDPEDDNDFASDQYDVIAGGDAETPPEVDPGTGKEKAKSSPMDDNTDGEPVDDPKAVDDEEPAADEDPAADEEPADDADAPKKRKRKRKNGNPAPAEPAAEGVVPDGPALNEKQTSLDEDTQEKDMTIGNRFLERVLNEADGEDNDGVKDGFNIPLDSQARAMAAKQKLPWAKRLVAFHYMCGVPGRYMNTPEVSEAVATAADMLRKKVAVRRAFNTLYTGMAAAKGYNIPQADAANESLEEAKKSDAKRLAAQDPEKILKAKAAVKAAKKALADHNKNYDGGTGARAKKLQAEIDAAMGKLAKLTEGEEVEVTQAQITEAKNKRGSFIQKLLESVLVELGLPEPMIVTTGPAVVGVGIYNTAELIEQDSTLERALRLLATRMGIKGQDAMAQVDEAKKQKEDDAKKDDAKKSKEKDDAKKKDAPDDGKFSALKKMAEAKTNEAVDVGNDDYAQAVTALVSALGIPDDVLERRRTQVVQALRAKKATIRNRAQVLTMISRVMDILSKNTEKDGAAQADADVGN